MSDITITLSAEEIEAIIEAEGATDYNVPGLHKLVKRLKIERVKQLVVTVAAQRPSAWIGELQ